MIRDIAHAVIQFIRLVREINWLWLESYKSLETLKLQSFTGELNMLNKRLVINAAAVGTSLLLLAASSVSFAGEKNYAEYGKGQIPMNSYGECWETAVGLAPTPECGGKKPMMVEEDPDSDNDGVKDSRDRCPNTAPGVPVDAWGCDLDSDGDGVPDYKDNCPRTPAGVKVDSNGCPLKIVLKNVLFGHDKSTLKPEARSTLDAAAGTIKNSGAKSLVVTGHTDSSGDASFGEFAPILKLAIPARALVDVLEADNVPV